MAVLHAVVGDVHGQLDALRRLEERVVRHAAREGFEPKIVSVGDLVDRGPDSAGVVAHFAAGAAAGTHAAVIGNHEAMFLAVLHALAPHLLEEAGNPWPRDTPTFDQLWERKSGQASRWLPKDEFLRFQALSWLVQGGATTLASYGATEVSDPATWAARPDHLRFLAELPVVFRTDTIVVTHALLEAESLAALDGPEGPPREKARELATWGRALPRRRVDPVRTHVSGHTPLKGVRRRDRVGVLQCDTGAGFGRRLSAWCAETDRVLSVAV